jgi:hypothetical protein
MKKKYIVIVVMAITALGLKAQVATNGFIFDVKPPVAAPAHQNPEWRNSAAPQIMGLWNGGSLTSLQYAVPILPEHLAAPANGATGRVTRFPIEITRTNGTFVPAQIQARVQESTSAGYLNETLLYENANFSGQLIGYLNGPDGVIGTSDDEVITSGSLNRPVNRIRFAGAEIFYIVNDEATMQQVRQHMAENSPFTVSVEYLIRENGTVIGSHRSVATTEVSTQAPQLAIAHSGGLVHVSLVNANDAWRSLERSTTLGTNAVWEFAGPIAMHAPYRTAPAQGAVFYRAR